MPRLDEVLGGGIAPGSLVIVVGPPGSGKTTLANQLAFAAARARRRAITFTALSESSDKLAAHLRTLSFFDEALFGDAVQFISLQQFLPGGLEATGREVVKIAREARANLVVVDGFRGVRGVEDKPQEARQFLYDVGARLGITGTTVVITTEADPHAAALYPEATTADVIIGLHFGVGGVRQRRALEVVKARGARLLPGLHGLHLTKRGLAIFPRLEARVAADRSSEQDELDAQEMAEDLHISEQVARGNDATPSPRAHQPDVAPLDAATEAGRGLDGRAPFDLPELDSLLGGGLTRNSSTVLVGSPGTGKTLLALQYVLAGVAAGEPVVYVGLREDRAQLVRKADMFDLAHELRAAILPGGGLALQSWAPVELDPDVVTTRLLAAVDRVGARRVVVDSIGEIERAVARSEDPGRLDDFLAALLVSLRERSATALFVKESATLLAPEIAGVTDEIAVLAENVIYTQHVSYQAELHRVLSVVKMRFSAHDTRLREFTISAPRGVRVLAEAESRRGLLEGITSEQSARAGLQPHVGEANAHPAQSRRRRSAP